jgi:hypothetical protein
MRTPVNVALGLAIALLATACSGVAETLNVASAPNSVKEKKVTLQYRVARDAFAPSKFVGVVGDGITPGLSLIWELPLPESKAQELVQQEEKERFHRLIEMLEARQINGVEFECTGDLNRFVLRATAVPRLTEMGVRQVENSEN